MEHTQVSKCSWIMLFLRNNTCMTSTDTGRITIMYESCVWRVRKSLVSLITSIGPWIENDVTRCRRNYFSARLMSFNLRSQSVIISGSKSLLERPLLPLGMWGRHVGKRRQINSTWSWWQFNLRCVTSCVIALLEGHSI